MSKTTDVAISMATRAPRARRAIYLVGRPTQFSIAKAKTELGWQPRVSIGEGVRLALAGYFAARQTKSPQAPMAATG